MSVRKWFVGVCYGCFLCNVGGVVDPAIGLWLGVAVVMAGLYIWRSYVYVKRRSKPVEVDISKCPHCNRTYCFTRTESLSVYGEGIVTSSCKGCGLFRVQYVEINRVNKYPPDVGVFHLQVDK